MPLIRETIVITASRDGRAHIAPIGLIAEDGWIIAVSAFIDKLVAVPFATASSTDDGGFAAALLVGAWPPLRRGGARASSCQRAFAHRTRRH